MVFFRCFRSFWIKKCFFCTWKRANKSTKMNEQKIFRLIQWLLFLPLTSRHLLIKQLTILIINTQQELFSILTQLTYKPNIYLHKCLLTLSNNTIILPFGSSLLLDQWLKILFFLFHLEHLPLHQLKFFSLSDEFVHFLVTLLLEQVDAAL